MADNDDVRIIAYSESPLGYTQKTRHRFFCFNVPEIFLLNV